MILCNWSWRSSTHKFGGQRLFYFKLYPLIGYGVFSEAPHGAKKIIGPILQEEVPPHKPGREATVGTYLFGEISINQLHKKCIRNQHQHQHQSTIISISISIRTSQTFWRVLQAGLGWGLQAGCILPSLQKPQSSRCLRMQRGLCVGETKSSLDWVDGRVAKCQFFYTEQNPWTKFYPKKSA